jgi:hypothetical protein
MPAAGLDCSHPSLLVGPMAQLVQTLLPESLARDILIPMATGITILDPTNESKPATRQLLARPASIKGLTIGLLDISKPRGNLFLNRIEELLTERGAKVLRYSKPTFTKPAPVDLRQEIATQCNLVIEALAD